MHIVLPNLPFEKNALEPYISAETLEYHHGKHHAGYVKKYNALVAGTKYETMPLLDVIKSTTGPIFNNGAQAFNHDFYWKCLTPKKTKPSWKLERALTESFGGVAEFVKIFTDSAINLFGSGWTWLVIDEEGKLNVENGFNAQTPIQFGRHPLLVCDVWEHAYYIDTRNERAKYVENFWHVVNWEFVSENYEQKCMVGKKC